MHGAGQFTAQWFEVLASAPVVGVGEYSPMGRRNCLESLRTGGGGLDPRLGSKLPPCGNVVVRVFSAPPPSWSPRPRGGNVALNIREGDTHDWVGESHPDIPVMLNACSVP